MGKKIRQNLNMGFCIMLGLNICAGIISYNVNWFTAVTTLTIIWLNYMFTHKMRDIYYNNTFSGSFSSPANGDLVLYLSEKEKKGAGDDRIDPGGGTSAGVYFICIFSLYFLKITEGEGSVMELLILFFGLPLMSLIWFIFDLVLFLKCPKEEQERRRRYRNQIIMSGVLAFVFIGGVILVMYWFSQAMQHM